MTSTTINVLNRAHLGSPINTPLIATTTENIYRIEGTAIFVGDYFLKQIVIDTNPTCTTDPTTINSTNVSNGPFDVVKAIRIIAGGEMATALSPYNLTTRTAMDKINQHVRTLSISIGEKYRYYTRSTNRWDLATFEMTGTDMGRIMMGYAVKVPGRKSRKRHLLAALNTVWDLHLTAEEIEESVNN